MSTLRIALAQINPIVGALEENAALVAQWHQKAAESGADIVAFPELAIIGYPPEDLLLRDSFVQSSRKVLRKLAQSINGPIAIVGTVHRSRGKLYNAAAVLSNGKIAAMAHKKLLPNYGVFDEKRYFSSGARPLVLDISGKKIGINICEDVWQPEGPSRVQCANGAQCVINISASPYYAGKSTLREEVVRNRVRETGVPFAMVNLVGGQDELVFDGGSFCLDRDGELIARAPQFEPYLLIVDIPLAKSSVACPTKKIMFKTVAPSCEVSSPTVKATSKDITGHLAEDEEILQALILGTRDYVRKNGFSKVVLGLSGGIDSSLVAVVAAKALGPENVTGISMPSRYSSKGSKTDAQQLAENLNIAYRTIPIEEPFASFLKEFAPHFEGRDWDLAEENIQARIRGVILMALSNKFGWIVLTTGNKSEMSVGYATLYGDMAGGFAVIKDIPKIRVYSLCNHINKIVGREVIPRVVLEKPPSAELRPDQKDSDSLPEYEVLDNILEAYVEKNQSADQIVAMGYDKEEVLRVIKMVDQSEYKRRQAPPGIKITPLAFGRDRRMPITQRADPEV